MLASIEGNLHDHNHNHWVNLTNTERKFWYGEDHDKLISGRGRNSWNFHYRMGIRKLRILTT